jgi:pyruvate,orthophosphate dikinase
VATRRKAGAKKAQRKQAARRSNAGSTAKTVYFFGAGEAEGGAEMRDVLGGKGANLAEMVRLGVPVPAGFTISTEVCGEFYRRGQTLPRSLIPAIRGALARVEAAMDGRFGDPERPLLLSVRSGARVSMPGMMDTVLNLGLNDDTVEGLAARSGDRRFAFDSYRRFVQMYGDVVLGIEHGRFEHELGAHKRAAGVAQDTELSAQQLSEIVKRYKAIVLDATGKPFPEPPFEQLLAAVAAVFSSWNTPRAVAYRRLESIPEAWGTAVTVQAMVFGNLGDDSATGVAFTRDPSTGERRFFGEFLPKAQGEDVVAGIRTPFPLEDVESAAASGAISSALPRCFAELRRVADRLERHYRDMQDLEFTVQNGRLWMLQTRSGKRTARAAVRIAVDMVKERLIDRRTAVLRVDARQVEQLLHPTLDRSGELRAIGVGQAASPGAASGAIALTPESAQAAAKEGRDVILVRRETSAEDILGMSASRGILTSLGGKTSHAAVVARGMGKSCVTGCEALRVFDEHARIGDHELREGDIITLDGATGEIFLGALPMQQANPDEHYYTLMKWADGYRRLRVRTNVEIPEDAALAREFGAEGIGLCRTEHMFFQPERILQVRKMILAETPAEREAALHEILPMQRQDFAGILEAMAGFPVTIRLLDPPLHEFLPQEPEVVAALAASLGIPVPALERKIRDLHEVNPMLGHRGCRVGISHPEIYAVQVRAILLAACDCAERGLEVAPEIMIPLVAEAKELVILRALVDRTAREVLKERGQTIKYKVGTMIEVPRAALTAGAIAHAADFASFGTNDLTQTTLALSRDDAGRFVPEYIEQGIFPADPFVTLDRDGVGRLIEIAVQSARAAVPGFKAGICGEHGGDPASVRLCHRLGLDYVSCSPFRVPVARLAAGQAALLDAEPQAGDDEGIPRASGRKRGQRARKTAGTAASGTRARTRPQRKVTRGAGKKSARKRASAPRGGATG